MRVNASLVHSRRRDLGLTQRQLAKDLGVTTTTISSLESGDNHHALTLQFVDRLADALAVHPFQLLEATAEVGPEVQSIDLVGLIGSLLWETRTLTPITAIAEATGADLVEVEEALATLAELLEPVGLGVHRRAGDVAIQPNAARDRKAVNQFMRRHLARRGLNLREAVVLRRVADGDVDEASLSNPDRVALASLRKAGLVEGDRYPQLTSGVSSSLNPID